MNVQLHDTQKLFFNKYLYKLSLSNSLGYLFRNKAFKTVSTKLNEFVSEGCVDKYDSSRIVVSKGIRLMYINIKDIKDARILNDQFLNEKGDFKLRVEGSTLDVYSNNEKWLMTLASSVSPNKRHSLFRPNPAFLSDILAGGAIVTDPALKKYKYKVYVKNDCGQAFADWFLANTDKVYAGPRFIKNIQKGSSVYGYYFYVTTKKVLDLVHLLIDVRNVVKLVHKEKTDK